MRVWDLESQQLLHTFEEHEGSVDSVGYSPDGKYLVSGSSDKTVRVWDLESQQLLHNFEGHKGRVNSVGYSPDGKYLVSGSLDGTVRQWDLESQKLLHTFEGHEGEVNSVGYSPDGKYLVSGSADRTVRLWSAESQKLLHTFEGHEGEVNSVGYSPDGKYLVSGSLDGTVRLWLGSNWQEWLAVGCDRLRLHPVFVSTQTDIEATTTCMEYGGWSKPEKAEFLVRQGLNIAEEKGDAKQAKGKFQQAYKLDSENVNLAELEAEANQLAAQTAIERGRNRVKQGKVTEALSLYKQAQKIDPDLEIDAESWNTLCRFGSIYRQAEQVLFACEKAIELAPREQRKASYLDSRGLARALTGNTQGAIEDFQAYVDSPRIRERYKRKPQQWIDALKKGEDPFTDEVLEELK